ncbi:MAG: septum formation initiator family protein [bacterium]|nr:septum formation initiator family protein [bacterium]
MKSRGPGKSYDKRPSVIGQTLRRWFFLASLGIVTLFGILGLFGENGVLDMIRLKSLHRSLGEEISQLQNEQEDLKSEIARLKDPRYVEFLARDHLGLLRSNEIFIVLDQQPPGKH